MSRKNYLALLSALTAEGSDPSQAAAIIGKLVDQGEVDPELAAVAQLLARPREDRTVEEQELNESDSRARFRRPGRRSARNLLPRIRSLLREMKAELVELREANDTLARALGACYLCWGGEQDCPVCGGHGAPGSFEPDRLLFKELIQPAVLRLTTGDQAGGSDPAEGPPPAGETDPT